MTLITISSAPIGDVTPLYSHVTKLTSLLLLNHVRGGPRWDDLFFTRCMMFGGTFDVCSALF